MVVLCLEIVMLVREVVSVQLYWTVTNSETVLEAFELLVA